MIRMVSWNIARRFPAQEHRLPTGGGKTVIGGVLLAHWLADNRKAVWLTHRKELAEQTRGMLTDAGVSARTNIRWPPGTDAPAMAGGVVILMAQTVGRRTDKHQVWNRYNPNDLMVIDEAHHAAAAWLGAGHGAVARPHRRHDRDPVAQVGKRGVRPPV